MEAFKPVVETFTMVDMAATQGSNWISVFDGLKANNTVCFWEKETLKQESKMEVYAPDLILEVYILQHWMIFMVSLGPLIEYLRFKYLV